MQISSIRSNIINNTYHIKNTEFINSSYVSTDSCKISFKGYQYDDRNFFQRKWDELTKKNISNEFLPTYSITEDEHEYLRQILEYERQLPPKDIKKFYLKTYNSLKTQEEKEKFKKHFGEYLPQEQPEQSSNNSPNTQHQTKQNDKSLNYKTSSHDISRQRSTQDTTSNPQYQTQKPISPKNNSEYQQPIYTANIQNKIRTEEELIAQIDSLEEKDIPQFVTKIAKGTRDEQYNLADAYTTLRIKQRKLIEEDPSKKYKKELKEKYSDELKTTVEQEFIQEGRKYNSTDVIKEKNRRLEQMAADAGYGDNLPETKKLGSKLYALENEMKNQNISFVPKAPEHFETDEEKWRYINRATSSIGKNEASTFDALDVFEKYGAKRYSEKGNGLSSLEYLGTDIRLYIDSVLKYPELSNKVIQRFIEVHSKFATDKIEPQLPDAREMGTLLKSYKYYMNKDTMITLINQITNLAVDKDEYKELKFMLDHFSSNSMLYHGITENDLPNIQKAIDELGKKVENLPDDYLKVEQD